MKGSYNENTKGHVKKSITTVYDGGVSHAVRKISTSLSDSSSLLYHQSMMIETLLFCSLSSAFWGTCCCMMRSLTIVGCWRIVTHQFLFSVIGWFNITKQIITKDVGCGVYCQTQYRFPKKTMQFTLENVMDTIGPESFVIGKWHCWSDNFVISNILKYFTNTNTYCAHQLSML